MTLFKNLLTLSSDYHPLLGDLPIVCFNRFILSNPDQEKIITQWNDYLDRCGHAYGAKLDLFNNTQLESFIFDTMTLTISTQFPEFPPAQVMIIAMKNTYTQH
jgi:hypothetical protein